jgi:hypothetical protein
VAAFFRQHKQTISFVAAVDIPEAHTANAAARPWLRHRPRVRLLWNPHSNCSAQESVKHALEQMISAMPHALTASEHARSRDPNPDWRYHNSFGGSMHAKPDPDGHFWVRISARAALQALAGDPRLLDGMEPSASGFFRAQLAAGRTIHRIQLQQVPGDDDDWLEIDLGPDASISPFKIHGRVE